MIKLIILDCDGVILDSNIAYEKVFEKLFRKYGIRATKSQILHHFGEHPRHMLQEFFHKHNVREVYKEYVRVISSRTFIRHVKLMPKTRLSLKKLKKEYKIVLATGAIPESLYPALRKFSLRKYFDSIITGDDVKHAKPNPAMIIKCLKKTRTKPSEAIYIGDAPNDVKAAKRAGVKFVAVLTGVLSRKQAKKMKSDFIVSDLSKIDRVLKEL